MASIVISIVAREGDARRLASHLPTIAGELRMATLAVLGLKEDITAENVGFGIVSLIAADNLPRIQVAVSACQTHERQYLLSDWKASLVAVMQNLHKMGDLFPIQDLLREQSSVRIELPPSVYVTIPAFVQEGVATW